MFVCKYLELIKKLEISQIDVTVKPKQMYNSSLDYIKFVEYI